MHHYETEGIVGGRVNVGDGDAWMGSEKRGGRGQENV